MKSYLSSNSKTQCHNNGIISYRYAMIITDDTESHSLDKILTAVFRMSTFQGIQLINYIYLARGSDKITRDKLKTSVLHTGKLVLAFNSLRMALDSLDVFCFLCFFGQFINCYQLVYRNLNHCIPLFLHTLVVSEEVMSLFTVRHLDRHKYHLRF